MSADNHCGQVTHEHGFDEVNPLAERRTRWDNSMNQMYRFSRGFDLERHVREVCLLYTSPSPRD